MQFSADSIGRLGRRVTYTTHGHFAHKPIALADRQQEIVTDNTFLYRKRYKLKVHYNGYSAQCFVDRNGDRKIAPMFRGIDTLIYCRCDMTRRFHIRKYVIRPRKRKIVATFLLGKVSLSIGRFSTWVDGSLRDLMRNSLFLVSCNLHQSDRIPVE